MARLPSYPRRRSLRLVAHATGAALAASALSALAQPGASGVSLDSYGTPSDAPQRIGEGAPIVALVVPPANGLYGRAALALVDGVRAAYGRDSQGMAIEIIEAGESSGELATLCETLQGRGFQLAIGPLTRDAVTALATSGPPALPVLALNQPENVAPPGNLLVFGLSIENEADQVASYAWQDASALQLGRRPRAAIVHDGSAVSRRSVDAFVARWYQSGGEYYEPIETTSASAAALSALLRGVEAEVVFAAVSFEAAAALQAIVRERGRVYGTSLLNSGALPVGSVEVRAGEPLRSPEMDGIRIVAMPWQLQPGHAAVMAYPRPRGMNVELQKLYALGIDAFRLSRQLLAGADQVDLDGVSGRLQLDLTRDPYVHRWPLLAEYRDGVLTAVEPR
jgi:outer membrane PBP1 activator LpoA protein